MGELHGWRYCPRCGGELRPAGSGLRCAACGSVYYANAKPTASAVIVDERGRILLSRRAFEPYRDKWDLPGGFLEEDEEPLDCLRRELREETGLDVDGERFLGVWLDRYGDGPDAVYTLNLYWSAQPVGGTAVPGDDVAELRWFEPGEVPLGELGFPSIRDVLRAWRDEHA